ncbi:tetratricopeptide repeat protein [Pararhizobium sp. A13]|uniref:tetratricopeptide repeat protein n=1 Tax=Pararhizobium sp. A13 TaxID=3133975 RepID=UPI00311B33F6
MAGLLAAFWLSCLFVTSQASAAEKTPVLIDDPLISRHDGFVDEKRCASCHTDQASAFAKSNHAKAMAVADEMTVLGDLNNVRFEHDDVETTFFRRGSGFHVRTEGPDGKAADFEIKYTFGYEPLQQYLADIGGGRLQALDVAWDTVARRWFWLGQGKAAEPGSTYHWTGPFYRWNRTCIDCHSTDPRANFEPATNEYKSTYVATSIGCQSCHGAGAKHVDWAEARGSGVPSAVEVDVGLPKIDTQVCFGCHSRRMRLGEAPTPQTTFLDAFSPALMSPDLYHSDGQILDEVFEWGSFQQSKMARAGVTCLDCHSPHEGAVKTVGNALCTQCHAATAPERFASADPSGSFDEPSHTHHAVGTAGAQCVSCHMPRRTYMKVDPRRDHSLVIPRPDLSAAYGTPNACTGCHEDRTGSWAAVNMDRWYGTGWRQRPTTAHAFYGAARNDPASIELLRKLVAEKGQAGIVKGSAIVAMSGVPGADVASDVRAAAADADPLVRLGAAEAARNLPAEQRWGAIGNLAGDEARAVRIAAATALGSTLPASLFGDDRRAFEAAIGDLRAYVRANADVAEIQNNYGTFLFQQQRPFEAEGFFQQAIILDPTFSGALRNLGELYRATGHNEKSEQAYADAVSVSPGDAELRYGHGLSLVRQKTMDEAIGEFEQAVRLDQSNTRYKTTLSAALDAVGRTPEAFELLERTIASGGSDAELLRTAIGYGLKLGRLRESLRLAQALARLQPDDPQIADLIRQLREASGTK